MTSVMRKGTYGFTNSVDQDQPQYNAKNAYPDQNVYEARKISAIIDVMILKKCRP